MRQFSFPVVVFILIRARLRSALKLPQDHGGNANASPRRKRGGNGLGPQAAYRIVGRVLALFRPQKAFIHLLHPALEQDGLELVCRLHQLREKARPRYYC